MDQISTGKKLMFVAAVLAVGFVIWYSVRGDDSAGGAFVNEGFQEHVAVQVARVAGGLAESAGGGRIGVLSFVTGSSGPYAAEIEALTDELKQSGHQVAVFNAVQAGITLEGHYTPALEAALQKTAPKVMIVMATGDLTALESGDAIDAFVGRGGKLVFVGKVERADSPALQLIREGAAVAVARNMGLLSARRPPARTLDAKDAEDYFKRYYTVLTRDNIAGLIPARR